MRFFVFGAFVLTAVLSWNVQTARAGGFAFSENFIVTAPDQRLADDVLAQAERFRKELAVKWLGAELPTGSRCLVSVESAEAFDGGTFWAIDDPQRKLHKLRLPISSGDDLNKALGHEVSHLVMQIAFGGELPLWANEGFAVFEHPDHVARTSLQLIRQYEQSNIRPELQRILQRNSVEADDGEFYSMAHSLTAYLLTLGDAPTVLKFALSGKKNGWDTAARETYGLTLDRLQASWRVYAARSIEEPAPDPRTVSQPAFTADDRRTPTLR